MPDILKKIVARKKIEVAEAKKKLPMARLRSLCRPAHRDFYQALQKPHTNIIAEIKKASPSRGVIRPEFNHLDIFREYEPYAAAISILTDEAFFQGSLQYLRDIDYLSSIPLLRKDFIIDEYQIFESREAGADAILLIAAILDRVQIQYFLDCACKLEMSSLVEIHNELELEKVLGTSASIIGINNRNLHNFSVDLNTSMSLAEKIPKHCTVVIESAIGNRPDIEQFSGIAHNFLIGTAFMKSNNIREKFEEFL